MALAHKMAWCHIGLILIREFMLRTEFYYNRVSSTRIAVYDHHKYVYVSVGGISMPDIHFNIHYVDMNGDHIVWSNGAPVH